MVLIALSLTHNPRISLYIYVHSYVFNTREKKFSIIIIYIVSLTTNIN